MAYNVRAELCPQNHRCPLLRVCPVGAISQEGYSLPVFDADKCIECGKCAKVCGMSAVYKVNK